MLGTKDFTTSEKKIISYAASIKKEFTSESALINDLIDDVVLQSPEIMNRNTMDKNGNRFKKIIRMEPLFNDKIYDYAVDRCFRIFRLYGTDSTRNKKNDWFVCNVLLFQVIVAINSCISKTQEVPINDDIINMMDQIEKQFVVPEKDGIAGTIANHSGTAFFSLLGGATLADLVSGPDSMNVQTALSGAPINITGASLIVILAKMIVAYRNKKYREKAENNLI